MTTKAAFEILKKKETLAFLLASACTFILFPTFFNLDYRPLPGSGPSWLSLDPSWHTTLSEANLRHLNWGKDFVFTYGPLSYLTGRIGWGASRLNFVLFDLLLSFNFFYLFYTSYKNSNEKRTTAFLILSTTFLLPVYFGSGYSIVLAAFLIFWIRKSLDDGKPFFYIMQALLLVLLFFIKFNTGLISLVFFCSAIVYKLLFTKEKKLLLIMYFMIPMVLIFFLSFPFHVSLGHYLKGGLELIKGYNDIMYLNENYVNEFRFSLVIILLTLFILLLKTWQERPYLFKNLLVFFLFSSILYVLYKQAFTRADMHHIQEFYKYVLLFILCLPDLHFNAVGKHSLRMLLAVVFIALFFVKRREEHLFRIADRLSKTNYIRGFVDFTPDFSLPSFPIDNQLPPAVKHKIGKSAVDIYPWNSNLLFENSLNFRARPVFQSNLAFTPYLENLNIDFYNSVSAPPFVIYEYDAIDGRYPLFDETKLNLLLLKQYSCIDTFRYAQRLHLVLQKKPGFMQKINFEKVREYEAGLSEAILPKANHYYELEVSKNISGKLKSLLHQSPELLVIIKLKNGSEHQYRSSVQLLKTGIFSDHFFGSTLDFYNYLTNDSLAKVADIASYSLQPANPVLFNEKIIITEYRIH